MAVAGRWRRTGDASRLCDIGCREPDPTPARPLNLRPAAGVMALPTISIYNACNLTSLDSPIVRVGMLFSGRRRIADKTITDEHSMPRPRSPRPACGGEAAYVFPEARVQSSTIASSFKRKLQHTSARCGHYQEEKKKKGVSTDGHA